MKIKRCGWKFDTGKKCKEYALDGEFYCEKHLNEKINSHIEQFKIILGYERLKNVRNE